MVHAPAVRNVGSTSSSWLICRTTPGLCLPVRLRARPRCCRRPPQWPCAGHPSWSTAGMAKGAFTCSLPSRPCPSQAARAAERSGHAACPASAGAGPGSHQASHHMEKRGPARTFPLRVHRCPCLVTLASLLLPAEPTKPRLRLPQTCPAARGGSGFSAGGSSAGPSGHGPSHHTAAEEERLISGYASAAPHPREPAPAGKEGASALHPFSACRTLPGAGRRDAATSGLVGTRSRD